MGLCGAQWQRVEMAMGDGAAEEEMVMDDARGPEGADRDRFGNVWMSLVWIGIRVRKGWLNGALTPEA
jgi:hypothetical protein